MQLKRTKLLAGFALGALTLTIVACSSSISTVETSPGFGRVGGVGPVGSTGVVQPTEPPRCPADPPKAGSSCSGFGTSGCTYGPDVRSRCVETYECYAGDWEDVTGSCAVQCPKTFAEIAPGTACGDDTMACSYDEGTCGCVGAATGDAGPEPDASTSTDASTDGGDGGFTKPLYPGVWKCVPPPGDVACPSARPRVLDACVKRVTCDYGTCELGQPLSYSCQGVWQESFAEPSCDE